jgi:hypothetical protein
MARAIKMVNNKKTTDAVCWWLNMLNTVQKYIFSENEYKVDGGK